MIKILPNINYRHNIVCENPQEDCISNIIPYDMKQLCKIVGYSEKNHGRLKNDLFQIKVNGKCVIGLFEKCDKSMIVVNPAVYYAGNDIEELKALEMLFRA